MSEVKIETTRQGDGKNFPQRGDTVTVHYTGTLVDGSEFDSSRSRGKPFKFTLGVGQVIKCWDQAVAQLSKGQRAMVTCPYTHAYGERGHPGVIPPRATLKFDVELIEFK